jgi:hypothetical protein
LRNLRRSFTRVSKERTLLLSLEKEFMPQSEIVLEEAVVVVTEAV